MRLKYLRDRPLLSQIKRSYSQVWGRLRKSGDKVRTGLFEFENVDSFELGLRYIANICVKVTVLATGQVLVLTQHMSFRNDVWNLYTFKEELDR